MDFGVGYFPTRDGLSPGAIARLVEERGHESLFFAEHTHIPARRESPWPRGEKLPPKYFHTYDLFVAPAATSRLRVGSGICLIVERDPITTAKEVASVEIISPGASRVRHRRRLESRGDAQPWHRPPDPDALDGRARRGNEGDLDP